MTIQHTPGPWRVGEWKTRIETMSDHVNPWSISVACVNHYGPRGEADAAFIVRACNAYADLVAALKRLVNAPDVIATMLSPETIVAADQARAALAKAEGGAR